MHQGLYALMLIGSNFAAPIICGFIEDGAGWQWVFYVTAIFCGVVAVILFLFMEETNFDRSKWPLKEGVSHRDVVHPTWRNEKMPSYEKREELFSIPTRSKTYLQKLKLLDTSQPFTAHLRLKRQLVFLTWPVPLYCGFLYGSVLM